jgi:two-component system, chemotaxis family, CheB/CheR fusion protein
MVAERGGLRQSLRRQAAARVVRRGGFPKTAFLDKCDALVVTRGACGGLHRRAAGVCAESEGEGKGSEFTVRMPLTAPPPARPVEARHSEPGLAPGSRVVVIEDNADSREMLCALLSQAQFDCKSCDNGAAGLALIDEFQPLAAVVDIGLPGIDGLELARRVRAANKHPQLFMIALTGYGQRADRELALQAGFDEHVVKPVDLSALLRLLATKRSTVKAVSPSPAP